MADNAAPDDDPLYTLLAELERLEEVREALRENDPAAPADLRALGLPSPAALEARIAALHRQIDDMEGAGGRGSGVRGQGLETGPSDRRPP
jgi:hypothetical protein